MNSQNEDQPGCQVDLRFPETRVAPSRSYSHVYFGAQGRHSLHVCASGAITLGPLLLVSSVVHFNDGADDGDDDDDDGDDVIDCDGDDGDD